MITPIERKLFAYLGIILLVLVTLVFLVYLGVRTMTKAGDEVTHTLQVQNRIALVQSLVQDAETGQRGYLLTGDATYLAPYAAAVASLDARIAELRAALGENGAQAAALATFEALAHEKLAELRRTVEQRQSGAPEAALALLRAGSGKAVMDEIRKTVEAMDRAEGEHLLRQLAETERTDGWLRLTAVAMLSLSVSAGPLARALTPDGVLFMYEWIGPEFLQIPARNALVARLLLLTFPRRERRTHQGRHKGLFLQLPPSAFDPSEACASSLLEPEFMARFDVVRAWLDAIPNLFPVGRNGMHRYNNQDHSMFTAMLTVENICTGTTHDVWEVNVEDEYHEEATSRVKEKFIAEKAAGSHGTGRDAPVIKREVLEAHGRIPTEDADPES